MKKTLTVVAPVYNEEAVIADFYHALREEFNKLTDYDCDMIFAVDKCRDRTLEILKEIARTDTKVRVLGLSSRFGAQMSLLAGIDHARGDVVITMDADLQHPPAVISELLKEYEKGAEVVYTLRERTEGVGLIRRAEARAFYWFANFLSEVPILETTSDFRLITKRVADILRTKIRERNTFLRGIVTWMGFKQASVTFVAPKRGAGETKYSFSRLVQFAIFGLISFSKKPLRAATVVGAVFALFGFVFAFITIVQYFLGDIAQPGYATIIVLLSIFGGFQLMFLGVIGEYIGAIFDEVKARPHYLVEEAVNID